MGFSLCLVNCTAMRCFTHHAATLHTALHYCALISVHGWQRQLGDSECSKLVSIGCWDLQILDLTGCEAVSNSTCITVSLFASGLEQLSIRGTGMHCALSAGTLWYYQALCFTCCTAQLDLPLLLPQLLLHLSPLPLYLPLVPLPLYLPPLPPLPLYLPLVPLAY